jgi:hypothetical protein
LPALGEAEEAQSSTGGFLAFKYGRLPACVRSLALIRATAAVSDDREGPVDNASVASLIAVLALLSSKI